METVKTADTEETPKNKEKRFWKTPVFFVAATLVIGLAGGFGIGRYATPPEIQVETKTKTVAQMPVECQKSLRELSIIVNKYGELVKSMTHNIESLMGSTDWNLPVVIAMKTYQQEEITGLLSTYNTQYEKCEPFLQ